MIDTNLIDRLAGLEGLITEQTGLRLAELAGAVPNDQAIVELGSFKGKSASYLAAGAIFGAGAHVFAIDPWDLPGNVYGKHGFTDPAVRETFERQTNAVGVARQITPVREFSTRAAGFWTRPVGLLYIDGDHEYASVRDDFNAWLIHLAAGAPVVFDDYRTRNKGVTRFVDELVAGGAWTLDIDTLPLAIVRPQ